jgi:rare lipoprotein A
MIVKSLYVTLSLALVNFINPSNDEKANVGTASFYAKKFEGRRTSSGQRYRASKHTAAHRTYPFGTLLEITNHNNGLKTRVKVNDRGPHTKSRLIDLSYIAAKDLGLINAGIAKVTIKVISVGKSTDFYLTDDQPLKDSTTTSSTIPEFKPEFLEKKHQ